MTEMEKKKKIKYRQQKVVIKKYTKEALSPSVSLSAQQQYQSFPLPCFGLTGLKLGQTEPVLGHNKYEIVSLAVNDYFMC